MLPAFDRAPRSPHAAIVVRAPDPAHGIGRALRSVYTPGGSAALPTDLQALLDRLH